MPRWHWACALFVPSFLVGVNGGFWQLRRRAEKIHKLDAFENLKLPAIAELPSLEEPVGEYTRIRLSGALDNEGSMLVGPRPKPDHMNRINGDTARGGFLVMTPFEVVGTRQFVMVNRGWVPIDACKSRLHLVQYIGEGFKPATIEGIVRKEEFLGTWYGGDRSENYAPIPGGMAWQVARPFEMAVYYYKRRFGPDNVVHRQTMHGARRYYIEMIENMSGDDQVMVDDQVYPFRRGDEQITYVALLPIVHAMYSVFWFGIAGGSLIAMRKCFQMHRRDVIAAKLAERQAKDAKERITKSANEFKEEIRRMTDQKQRDTASTLSRAPTETPQATTTRS